MLFLIGKDIMKSVCKIKIRRETYLNFNVKKYRVLRYTEKISIGENKRNEKG